mgnify:CR=1 FL=1
MPVTKEQMMAWYEKAGTEGWEVKTLHVNQADWDQPERRAEFLCEHENLLKYYLHDAADGPGSRTVYFAVEI